MTAAAGYLIAPPLKAPLRGVFNGGKAEGENMKKESIFIERKDLEALERGDIDLYEITLDGLPAYIYAVDYETGLKIGDRNFSVNYYAPDPEDYAIEVF